MMELTNLWKGYASLVGQQMGQNRWGLVTSARQTDTGYEAKVTIQPDGITTAWLPVLSPMVGSGWGLVAPPGIGMQAFVAPDTGDGHHGVILGLAFSKAAMPPVPPNNFPPQQGGTPQAVPVASGELALVNQKGAVLRLCADGSVHIKGDVRIDGSLTVQNDITVNYGNVTVSKGNVAVSQGNLSVAEGTIAANNNDVSDQYGSLNRLRGNYDRHAHPSNGALPVPQDPQTKS